MAEFCLECLNKISGTDYTQKDFYVTKDLEFCEECRAMKHILVTFSFSYRIKKFFDAEYKKAGKSVK